MVCPMTIINPRINRDFFSLATTDLLTKDLLIDIATGVVGAVKVKRFASPERCAMLAIVLANAEFNAFDEVRYQVPTFNLGPIMNHYLLHGYLTEQYWKQAETASRFWREHKDLDLRQECRDRISDVWQGPVTAARVDGHFVYWGIVRENGRGAQPHWDDVSHEFPTDFFVPRPVAQLTFNLYLRMPQDGGDTVIWPRRWRPSDEAYRAGSSWPNLPFDQKPLTVHCELGDALVFDPRNYHSVLPGSEGRRFALGFYLGIASDGTLVTWS